MIVMFVAVITAVLALCVISPSSHARSRVRSREHARGGASQPLPVGTRLHEGHFRVVAWPSRNPVKGSFTEGKGLIDRGVIAPIGENEPITETKVAPLEAGAGLPPVIPSGMRAISVRVNEVIGVAGFAVPGSRVDVLVTVDGQAIDEGR